MNYTSIEQSKKLLELGLSPESADMYWAYTDKQNYVGLGNPPCDVTFGSPDEKAEIIPCWSVGALLSVLPLPSLIQDKADDELFWQCSAYDEDGTLLCEIYDNNAIDACYEIIIKLHEKGLL